EAALKAAEAQAAIASDMASRNAELAKTNTISDAQLRNATSSAAAAAAQVQAAKAQLAQARVTRRRHDLRAPFSGVLIDAPDEVERVPVQVIERGASSVVFKAAQPLQSVVDYPAPDLQDGAKVAVK